LGFKGNYLKGQGARGEHSPVMGLSRATAGSGSPGARQRCDWLAHWEMAMALGKCGKGRRDGERNGG
jgi:hypothetical protein